MNSQNDKEKEHGRRERELQERERAIRLRELEAQINQASPYQSRKHQAPESSLKRWYGKLVNVGQFLVIIVAVVVSFHIAATLAWAILLGAFAWVAYKLFF